MALTFNGVSPTAITYNRVNLTFITFNGVAVWTAFTSKDFPYTGTIQPWTVSVTGTYKLEVWGAQGARGSGNEYQFDPGLGGYSYGNVSLTAGTILYIVVGGSSSSYNGEGTSSGEGGNGGGATHIAKSTGLLKSLSTNKSSILIVAGVGGGGGSGYIGGVTLGSTQSGKWAGNGKAKITLL